MSVVHILAIDLAKRSFQACGQSGRGVCGCLRLCKGFFRLLLQQALLSVVCQASDRGQRHEAMQFEEQGLHRFRELCDRAPDWSPPPSGTLKSLPHSRQSISLQGSYDPERLAAPLREEVAAHAIW